MKNTKATAIGIILGWIALILFGIYKGFATEIIILFIVLAIATSSSTIFIGKNKHKKS